VTAGPRGAGYASSAARARRRAVGSPLERMVRPHRAVLPRDGSTATEKLTLNARICENTGKEKPVQRDSCGWTKPEHWVQ